MEQLDLTNRVPVTLTQTDWRSLNAVLQAQARQEHRRGNDEIVDEIRLLVDRIAIQL